MKKNWILFGGIALGLVVALLLVNSARTDRPEPTVQRAAVAPKQTPAHSHSPNGTSVPRAKHLPAYFEVAPSRASLGPILDPEKFTGLTRDAYRAVKQIPVTIAQLPCYCHCDEGFGHKSLYSCYEDDHAAHCDVCVREALLALSLEKDKKMTPAQIREHIVAQYGDH
jgi:Protein of unknown function with PCYCGC motif